MLVQSTRNENTVSVAIYWSSSVQKSSPFDSEDLPTNTSDNEHFQAVVERAYSRRGFLKSGLGLSAAMFLGGSLSACAKSGKGSGKQGAEALLGFTAIPTSTDDTLKIAAGYTATVFAPWGTPLFARSEERRVGKE